MQWLKIVMIISLYGLTGSSGWASDMDQAQEPVQYEGSDPDAPVMQQLQKLQSPAKQVRLEQQLDELAKTAQKAAEEAKKEAKQQQ